MLFPSRPSELCADRHTVFQLEIDLLKNLDVRLVPNDVEHLLILIASEYCQISWLCQIFGIIEHYPRVGFYTT